MTNKIITAVPIGTILAYAGEMNAQNRTTLLESSGMLFCDGAEVAKTEYQDLYDVIGTSFGQNTSGKFHLPDLRGQFLRGVDETAGRDPDRESRQPMAAKGNAGNRVGSVQDHSFKSHSHSFNYDIGLWYRSFKGEYSAENTICTHHNNKSITVTTSGGNETRPVNAYVNFIIKAKYSN